MCIYFCRYKIWCQAILRDDWVEADSDIPLNVVQKTVFYKLVALIEFMGEFEVMLSKQIIVYN